MRENYLNAENYYDNYSGWDLGLMYERLKSMELPEQVRESVRAKEKATLLVLGSATSDNLSRISQIDSYLRPGKVEQDTAVIIDQNNYPLARHAKDILSIEGKDGWSNTPKSTPEFPFPKFQLTQADIRRLPFAENKVDLIISDYTLNYLDNLEDINSTFKEISRTLSADGIALISFRGNHKYPYIEKFPAAPDNDHQQTIQGGVSVHYFPLHTYLNVAKQHGLKLVASDIIGTDLCAVLLKDKR